MRASSVQQFEARNLFRLRSGTILAILASAILGVVIAYYQVVGIALLAVPPALLMLALLWRNPKLGVFLLFFASVMIEAFRSDFSDATTDRIPFFTPIRNIITGSGVIYTPAELFMVLLALICLVRAVSNRTLRLPEKGIFFLPLIALYTWIILAVGIGALTGGVLKTALWEIRVPFMVLIGYIMTYNLLSQPKDLNILGWIVLLGSGLKGVQGTWRYVVTLNRDTSSLPPGVNSILEHDEAFFFTAYFFYTLLLFLTNGSKQQKRAALILLPFVLLANMANGRRAATGALVAALIILIPILFTVFKKQRVLILRLVAIGSVLITIYSIIYWNSNSAIAQPIRSIRSQFTPDARDEASDLYRNMENKNLYYTISLSPILGYGYGKEMQTPFQMADVTNIDPFVLIMPHNSILWVWMRLGTIGFFLFWLGYAHFLIYAARYARFYDTPLIRRWALFAIIVIIINLMIGYWDMGLTSPRIQIYLGVILGVLDRLPLINNKLQSSPTPIREGAS